MQDKSSKPAPAPEKTFLQTTIDQLNESYGIKTFAVKIAGEYHFYQETEEVKPGFKNQSYRGAQKLNVQFNR